MRKLRTENPYLDMAYDIEDDSFTSIGMSLPEIRYEIQRDAMVERVGERNYFNDHDYFADYNIFDAYYGSSI